MLLRGARLEGRVLDPGGAPMPNAVVGVTEYALYARGPASSQVPDAGRSSSAAVDAFLPPVKTLSPVQQAGRGRLVFAMDATMSRQPTWDMALALQTEMFDVVRDIGGLDVQLVYFRGAGECRASRWVADPAAFWAPYDETNERWKELKDHKSWWFGDTNKFPPWKELLESLNRVIARHPETTFVCVHFANNSEELDWVDASLSKYPSLR